MTEYNVRTDEDFFNKIIFIKNDVQFVAGMFQNEGTITNEEEIESWIRFINDTIGRLEQVKEEGLTRFGVRKSTSHSEQNMLQTTIYSDIE